MNVQSVFCFFVFVGEVRELAILGELVLSLEAVWGTHVVCVTDLETVLRGLLFYFLLLAHNAVAAPGPFLTWTVRM